MTDTPKHRIAQLRELLPRTTDRYDLIKLHDELSFWLRLSDPPGAMAAAREELRLARSVKDDHWIMRGFVRLGDCHYVVSKYAEAIKALRRAELLLDDLPDDPAEKAYVTRTIGNCHAGRGEAVRAMELYERSLEHGRRSGDRGEEIATITAMGMLYKEIADWPRALENFTEALLFFEEVGHNPGIIAALGSSGEIAMEIEDLDGAERAFNRLIGLVEETGSRISEGGVLRVLAELHRRKGAHEIAVGYQRRCLEVMIELDAAVEIGEAYAALARIGFEMGDLESASESVERGLAVEGETILFRSALLYWAGAIELARGNPGRAVSLLEEGLAIAERTAQRDIALELAEKLAEALDAAGDGARALEQYKKFIWMKRAMNERSMAVAVARMQARTEIERARREREEMRARADAIQREMEATSRELTDVSLRLARKGELVEKIRRELAGMVDEGMSEATALARSLIRWIDGQEEAGGAEALGERGFHRIHDDFIAILRERGPELTPTELKVCTLLRINLSTKEVASLLNSSVHTVETHRRRIRRKLRLDGSVNLITHLATLLPHGNHGRGAPPPGAPLATD